MPEVAALITPNGEVAKHVERHLIVNETGVAYEGELLKEANEPVPLHEWNVSQLFGIYL